MKGECVKRRGNANRERRLCSKREEYAYVRECSKQASEDLGKKKLPSHCVGEIMYNLHTEWIIKYL